MRNLKIKHFLAAVACLVSIIMIATGYLGLQALQKTHANTQTIYLKNLHPIQYLDTITRAMLRNRAAAADLMLLTSSEEKQEIIRLISSNRSTLDSAWASYQKIATTPAEQAVVREFDALYRVFDQEGLTPLLAAVEAGKSSTALNLYSKMVRPASQKARQSMDEALEYHEATAKAAYEHSIAILDASIKQYAWLLGLGLLAVFIGFWGLMTMIARPLIAMATTVDRIAKGNTAARVDYRSDNELGEVASSINNMADSIEAARQREQAAMEKERAEAQLLQEKVDSLLTTVNEAATGNLAARVMLSGDDAIGQLANGTDKMINSLRALIGDLQNAGIQVRTSITELAATVRQQEATTTEQAAASNEIAASTKEISATAKELVGTMDGVTRSAEHTATMANEGHQVLARLDETLVKITDASGNIVSKLGVLSQKAGNINTVVSTITKVADQTDLLSLNAAIEAEKAGEYGQGFSVVATEIRRLADQTSVAAWDIEQMLKEMQGAVSSSVMSMDKFNEEIRSNVSDVRQVGDTLGKIIEQVQSLIPQFDSVFQGMQAQSEGAEQIMSTMYQFSESIGQTSESLRNTKETTETLADAAGQLQQSVSRFRLN